MSKTPQEILEEATSCWSPECECDAKVTETDFCTECWEHV